MPDFLMLYAAVGAAGLTLSVIAWLGERRRRHRSDLDAIGFMPWTTIAFLAMLMTIGAGVAAFRIWMGR